MSHHIISYTRIHIHVHARSQGHVTISGSNIRGEGKIEQEKYSDLFTCGFFSIISVDDAADDIDQLGGGHAVVQGVDQ